MQCTIEISLKFSHLDISRNYQIFSTFILADKYFPQNCLLQSQVGLIMPYST